MPNLNKVSLIGHTGNKPELRNTPSGSSVTNFSLAVNDVWTDQEGNRQEDTQWFRVACWGRQAETVAQYLDKGRLCYVEGRIKGREYQRQDGTAGFSLDVTANRVIFLSSLAAPEAEEVVEEAPVAEEAESPKAPVPSPEPAVKPTPQPASGGEVDLLEVAVEIATTPKPKTEAQFRTSFGLDPRVAGTPYVAMAKTGALTESLVEAGKLVRVKEGNTEVYKIPE